MCNDFLRLSMVSIGLRGETSSDLEDISPRTACPEILRGCQRYTNPEEG